MLALVGHEEIPKLFAVDNFDQALHPRLACALTRLVSNRILADGSRQMLATTHNPLVLDGLNLLDDRIRLFAVDRDPQGATQINRVQVTEELMAQAESGLSRLASGSWAVWAASRKTFEPRPDMLRVGIVAEGTSDWLVLEEVMKTVHPDVEIERLRPNRPCTLIIGSAVGEASKLGAWRTGLGSRSCRGTRSDRSISS